MLKEGEIRVPLQKGKGKHPNYNKLKMRTNNKEPSTHHVNCINSLGRQERGGINTCKKFGEV